MISSLLPPHANPLHQEDVTTPPSHHPTISPLHHAPWCTRPHMTPQTKVRMAACNQKNQNQRWELSPGGRVRHLASDSCLDMGEGAAGQEVTLAPCGEGKGQVWTFDFYEEGREHWRPQLP